jgi:hypothetical protein
MMGMGGALLPPWAPQPELGIYRGLTPPLAAPFGDRLKDLDSMPLESRLEARWGSKLGRVNLTLKANGLQR